MTKCCICLAVMNVAWFIHKIISNCNIIGKEFDEYKIIFFYDTSNDGTINLLNDAKSKCNNIVIIENKTPLQGVAKTHKLALARNELINYVRTNHNDYEYFMMMDADEICTHEPDMNVFKKYFYRTDWDCLTFNKPYYYDLWALSMPDLPYSCWHFNHPVGYDSWKESIHKKLKKCNEGELISVLSAFNGFGIYRTNKFKDATYDGHTRQDLIPEYMMKKNIDICGEPKSFYWDSSQCQDCEHRAFHMYARIMNDAKICICPEILFPKDPQFS